MKAFDIQDLIRAKAGFYERGESVADWARERSFSPAMVYAVLSGRTAARRGQAHVIAVALGLKPRSLSVASRPGMSTASLAARSQDHDVK